LRRSRRRVRTREARRDHVVQTNSADHRKDDKPRAALLPHAPGAVLASPDGHGLPGDRGARSVLEIRCHETPFALRHGQAIGRLVFEEMLETPRQTYGATLGSSYQGQELKLAKHFHA